MIVARRTLVRIGFALVPAAAVAFACTFPDVEFATSDAGASGGQDGTNGPDGSSPIGDGGPAVLNDATARSDVEAVVDASACAQRIPCDCDDDGYASRACDGGATSIKGSSGAFLKLGDCDDLDPLRYPGAPYRFIVPTGHDGDWNCDGRVDSIPTANFACTGTPVLGCAGQGIKGPPQSQCGTRQPYYECKPESLACRERSSQVLDVYCQ